MKKIVFVLVALFMFLFSSAYAKDKQVVNISDIGDIKGAYQYKNGVALIRDVDNNYYYFDANGKLVFTCLPEHNYTSLGMSKDDPLAPGVSTFTIMLDDDYHLISRNGNTIKVFEEEKYDWVSSVNEGLILVQEKGNEFADNPNIVYLDEMGVEKLRFSNARVLGKASIFSEGRAFFAMGISDSENLQEYRLGSGYPLAYMMIDKEGNEKELKVANISMLFSNAFISTLYGYESLRDTEHIEIQNCKVMGVTPFEQGEQYATASVLVNYVVVDERSHGTYTYNNSDYYLAFLNKNGEVFVTTSHYNALYGLPSCVNDAIIVGDQIIKVAESSSVILNVEQLSFVQQFKNAEDSFHSPVVEIYHMDDEHFFVILSKHISNFSYDYYGAIFSKKGDLIEGPAYIHRLPRYRENAYNYSPSYSDFRIIDGSYYSWQNTTSQPVYSSEIPVLSKDDLYIIATSDGYGYSDLWGNIIIEPVYVYATEFENNCAFVSQKRYQDYSYGWPVGIFMINREGKVITKTTLDETYTDISHDLIIYDHVSSEIAKHAETILSTGTAFAQATKMALLPTAVGETCAYIYDIATFNIPGFIKHVYSDVTYKYREDAADIILRSLLGEYEPLEMTIAATLMVDLVNSEEYSDLKTHNKATKTFLKHLDKLELEDEGWYISANKVIIDRISLAVDTFGAYVDTMEATLDEKMILLLLTVNYQDNLEYLETSIENCKDVNDEMYQIYSVAKKKLVSTYEQYLENSIEFIRGASLSEILFSEATYDVTAKAISSEVKKKLEKMGIVGKNAGTGVNVLLVAHTIVTKISEKVGTKDTYDVMQDLYENTIGLNAMCEELSYVAAEDFSGEALSEEELSNLINKAIALAEYRLVVLDNVKRFHDVNSSGEYFIDRTNIFKERYLIEDSLNWLYDNRLTFKSELLGGTLSDKSNDSTLQEMLGAINSPFIESEKKEVYAGKSKPTQFRAYDGQNVEGSNMNSNKLLSSEPITVTWLYNGDVTSLSGFRLRIIQLPSSFPATPVLVYDEKNNDISSREWVIPAGTLSKKNKYSINIIACFMEVQNGVSVETTSWGENFEIITR